MIWRCPEYDTWEGNRETVNVQLHTCDYVLSGTFFVISRIFLEGLTHSFLCTCSAFYHLKSREDISSSKEVIFNTRPPTTIPTVMAVLVAQTLAMELLDNMDLVCDFFILFLHMTDLLHCVCRKNHRHKKELRTKWKNEMPVNQSILRIWERLSCSL